MILNKTLIYWSRDFANHDQRFINLIEPYFKEVYVNRLPVKLKKGDVFVAGPLTIEIPDSVKKELKGLEIHLISWGYDLNEEIQDYSLRQNVIKNLGFASHVIVDSKQSENILRSIFAYNGNLTRVPYTFGIDMYYSKNQKSIKRIFLLRNWYPIHNNSFIIESLLYLGLTEIEKIGVAGKGPEKKFLIRELDSMYHDVIEDFGEVSEKQFGSAISNYGIGLSAAKSDGLSVSVIQAMSTGCLVLAPNLESNRELIQNGENAFLYSEGSRTSFCDSLSRIINLDEREISNIRENAIQTVKERFSKDLSERVLSSVFMSPSIK